MTRLFNAEPSPRPRTSAVSDNRRGFSVARQAVSVIVRHGCSPSAALICSYSVSERYPL